MHHVKLPQFEGPLDLLLSLIEKEKLNITELSLSQVTDQYLVYLRERKTTTLANLGNFLSIAAQLLLIKSRALLPILAVTPEEETAIQDLEERLKTYQRFRDAARILDQALQSSNPAYVRESYVGLMPVFYPPAELTGAELRRHFENVLGEIPLAQELEETSLDTAVTLEEKMASFQQHLASRVQTTFLILTEKAENKVEVIVSFLALLELIKQSFLSAEQDTLFTDIRITRSITTV